MVFITCLLLTLLGCAKSFDYAGEYVEGRCDASTSPPSDLEGDLIIKRVATSESPLFFVSFEDALPGLESLSTSQQIAPKRDGTITFHFKGEMSRYDTSLDAEMLISLEPFDESRLLVKKWAATVTDVTNGNILDSIDLLNVAQEEFQIDSDICLWRLQ